VAVADPIAALGVQEMKGDVLVSDGWVYPNWDGN
jgi:hypothetical protein